MAFDTKKIFDRVKGAANDVAGAVSDLGEKTGNKIDEMKLTARISDLRKEINNIYLELVKVSANMKAEQSLKLNLRLSSKQ